jgi:hypothetical protein
MTEISKNALKTRCFFANMCFRYVLCDSNHKKTAQKSSTIPSQQIYELKNLTFAPYLIQQSALPPVHSVECGLSA